MKKDLPKIYANPMPKKISNVQETFYDHVRKANDTEYIDVEKKLNQIFSATDFIYKKEANIKLRDKSITKFIVGKNDLYLLTFDNNNILLSDIVDIELK